MSVLLFAAGYCIGFFVGGIFVALLLRSHVQALEATNAIQAKLLRERHEVDVWN